MAKIQTCDNWLAQLLVCAILMIYGNSVHISTQKKHVWYLKSENVQCDILPASNDGEHSGVSHFSGVYILPISPSYYLPRDFCPSSTLLINITIFTPITPPSVIGHGIVGKDIPIMARLVKARHWSKQWQTCLSSPDLAATQISDGAKIQVRRRHVLCKDPTES
jgi:hypothetical protein